jgi:hypothetical protein
MQNKKLWIVLGVAALMMLMGFRLAESGNLHVTVNGEPVEGLVAAGAAGGGLLGAALMGLLVLMALMLLGSSMILAGVLLAFAPFLLPGVALGLIWWWRRKDAKPAANVEGK